MFTTAFVNVICVVYATDLYNTKIEQSVRNITRSKNVSDDKIIIGELYTFVNDNGLRRQGNELEVTRIKPIYYNPSERQLNLKILDMMRQSLYATQDRIQALDPILEKYKNDPSLRMAFIFNRLKQLIIDIRRIYTLAVEWRANKRVFEQVQWYAHCARKYTDVLYIVQHVIDTHAPHVRALKGVQEEPKMPGFKP